MTGKPRFHHGNLRPALLDGALKILDEAGPDAVTIRAVARRAGVSHAAPANHFKDRQALMTELAILLFDQLHAEIEKSLQGARGDDARLRVFADCLIDFGLANGQRYRMLWRRDLVDNGDPRLGQSMDRIYDALVTQITALIGDRPIDPHTIAIGLWSLAHGYTSMRLDGNFEAAIDTVSGSPRRDAIITSYISSITASTGQG